MVAPHEAMAGAPAAGPFDLDERALRALTNGKWHEHPEDVLPAPVAEMDCAVPDVVQDAIRALVDRRDYGYRRRGAFSLRHQVATAFVQHAAARFGWALTAERILPTADVVQGLYATVLAYSEPGDGAIVQVPNYPPMREVVRSTGREFIALPMRDDGSRFLCDPWELEARITPRTRLFILCNPQNPTGRVFTRDELTAMGEFCLKHDLVVLADEIHGDITYPGHRHIPFASLSPELAARTVTLTSATKSFNFPGLRCAILIFGSAALQERFAARIPPRLLGDINEIGAAATAAAWTGGDAWLDSVLAHLVQMRDRMVRRLAAELPGIKCRTPDGTFLSWWDCRALGLNTPAQKFFLETARIGFSPGENFDPDAAQFVRCNFATSAPILDQIIDRAAAAVRGR